MRIKIFLLLCISSVFYTSLLAQQTERDRAIYNQFLRPQDVKWIKHFFGRIDDFSDISIILAYDGKECKGRMEYLKSKDVFDLSGTLDENYNLNVKEYDKNKNLTGSIKGSISNGFLEGDWSNNNNTIGGILSLEELPDESRLPNFCGDNKWIRSYRGALQREEMKMILQKDGLNQIRGIAFKNKETYSINGEMSLDSTLVLTLTDNDDKHFGDIQATFLKDKDDIRAIFYNDNGERSYASYEEELEMHFICNEYADYTTSYQITYPKYNNENFNKYIEHIATPWLQECRKKVEQNRNEFSNTPPPNSRASTRGSAWCDIEYLNKKIISGFIVFSN
ncbi:MAG: hypothetical protein KBA06_06225, partial [Saprospiraceae bacterium]|nr:hypothetical protein [Saprospiraceae bacterium]